MNLRSSAFYKSPLVSTCSMLFAKGSLYLTDKITGSTESKIQSLEANSHGLDTVFAGARKTNRLASFMSSFSLYTCASLALSEGAIYIGTGVYQLSPEARLIALSGRASQLTTEKLFPLVHLVKISALSAGPLVGGVAVGISAYSWCHMKLTELKLKQD